MKFHLLFERSLEPIIIFDGDRIADCNAAALSAMGATEKQQLVGVSIEEISPAMQPDGQLSSEKARNITKDVLREGGSRFEWVYNDLGGRCFWAEVFLTHISFDEKALIYGVWRDITERKIVEESLRLSEKRYREMFEKNPQPSLVFDLDNLEIVDANLAAIEHYGFSFGEFISMKMRDLHPPGEIPQLLAHLSGPTLGKGKRFWKHVKKNGEIRDVEVVGHALDFPGRNLRIVINNDVTEVKKAEEDLQNSYERLRMLSAHIQEARENERNVIARELHDVLGQILTTVNMDLSWMNKRIPVKEKELLAKVSSMLSMVKQAIRTIQKVSSELRPAILDDFGFNAAIEHGIQSFEKQTGMATRVMLDRDIVLDKQRSSALYRIFQEATTNIIRHARATRLEVSLHRDKDAITLIMEDNGRGISSEEISGKRSFGILGMRERASFIGGQLEIHGSTGKGTRVKVTLPHENAGAGQ